MNRERILVEITKLRPHWPTHTIVALLDRPETAHVLGDPRDRSSDTAEAVVRLWDQHAAKRQA